MRSPLERILIALPWLSIPLLGWHLASTWSSLPQRIAVHFDLRGNANGWQSPTFFAVFAMVLLLFMLAVLTYALLRALRLCSLWRAMTVIHYFVIGTILTLLWQTLDHAAYDRPIAAIWPVPAIFPLSALLFAAIALALIPVTGAAPSANASLIAEERHRSPMQLFFFLPGVLIGFWLAIRVPGPPRIIGIFLIVVMGWVAVAVLEGFQYVVRSDGVQIRGFMLPLRFIPRATIRGYRSEPWSGLGYGIRLTATGTAYVWGGRKVVSITTDSGEVILGHYHPERLIGDLDRMMHVAQ